MKKLLLIGGSSGIGKSILHQTLEDWEVINFSRSSLEKSHENLSDFNLDILYDDLPDLSDLDAIIYCPGSINLKPFTSLSLEDFKTDWEINFLGAIRVLKKYVKQLKKAENASVVLFSTVAVGQGMPFHSSISSAKGAIEGLTRALAAEFAPKVRVNAIAPSVTDTPLAAKLLRSEALVEKIKNRHPLRRILSSSEVASMANFLISEQAAAISGQIFHVDAGLSNLRI